MTADTPDNMMEHLPHYREKYDAAKKIFVYFIPAHDDRKDVDMFFYALASASLHDSMMQSLKLGVIPDFAVVVEKGYGAPDTDMKARIKAYYGFDHDVEASKSGY